MVRDTWKATRHTTRIARETSVLYGSFSGGVLAEHSHSDVQVSVHFAPRSQTGAEPLHFHLYPSHQPHTGSWKPGHEVIVFHLATGLLVDARQELSRGVDVELVPAWEARDPVLEGLALLVRDEFHDADRLTTFYIESIGHLIARHLLRTRAAAPIAAPRPYALTGQELGVLCRFVHDHLHSGFSVRDLASVIAVGPGVLTQKLNRSIGLSPWRFVQQERLRLARTLLRQNEPIAQIAARLGYTDQSHFTHSFRPASGFTPRAYRDMLNP
jgi:AraC family transcriptional regulator